MVHLHTSPTSTVTDMSSLKGKLIALTGAASGIGRATALLLASRGASLSLADVHPAPLRVVADEIARLTNTNNNDISSRVLTRSTDVADSVQVDAWISSTVRHFGRPLDGAANMAGIGGKSIMTEAGLVRNLTNQEFDTVMRVNVGGLLNCLRAQLNVMRERGGGSIVNATSSAGIIGLLQGTPYAASKHAIVGMTRSVAKEEGMRGIRVNAVAPGMIATPLLSQLQDNIDKSGKVFPEPAALGRRGTSEEVAEVIAFLLAEESSFVSGMVYGVDGAWVC